MLLYCTISLKEDESQITTTKQKKAFQGRILSGLIVLCGAVGPFAGQRAASPAAMTSLATWKVETIRMCECTMESVNARVAEYGAVRGLRRA